MRRVKISMLPEAVKACDGHPYIKMNSLTLAILLQQGFPISGDIPISPDFAPTFVYAKILQKRIILDSRLKDLEIRMSGSETMPSICIHITPQEFVFVKILAEPSGNIHHYLIGEFSSSWLRNNIGNTHKAKIEKSINWVCHSEKEYRIIDGDTTIAVCEHWVQEVNTGEPLPARRIKI